MLIIFSNDLKSNFKKNTRIYLLFFSSHLFSIIQRCQPDLKAKYEDDFQMSLKDYTKWYVIKKDY
jgi:hypothetical protein